MTEETPAVALRCERRWRDRRHVSGTVCAVAPDGAAFSDTLRLDVARERAAFAAAIVARFGPVAGTAADLERRLEELHQQVEADLATAPPPPSGCPYRIEGDAILWDKPTRDGPVATPLTNFRALITGETERDDGSGELARTFTISATVGGRERTGEVAAARFAAMAWPTELLGAVAVLEPGLNARDHTRAAIQKLSGEPPRRTVYTHTGWRRIAGQWVYLNAGAPIGPDGPVADVAVDLQPPLNRFALPEPPTGAALHRAIRASLALLELGPARITAPLLSAIYRAVLGATDGSLHLAGQTGVFKSELSALGQQHYGAAMDRLHLPASWSATANALEELAFRTADALLVIDEYVPRGTAADIARLQGTAERVLRAQGNGSGRGRMRADGSLRPARPPRGLIVSTGEDVPAGASLRARCWVLDVRPGDIAPDRLAICQRDAAAGLYAQAMAAYVQWLAGRLDRVRATLPERERELRDVAHADSLHRRTPGIAASLMAGFEPFIAFATEAGAITTAEARDLNIRVWQALGEAAAAQTAYQQAADPVRRFTELVAAAIASGRAHLAATDGAHPAGWRAWGWRERLYGETAEYQPQGDRIGWVDGDSVYLEPDAAYTVAQSLAQRQGEPIAVGRDTLVKRLRERRLLLSVDPHGEHHTVRRVLAGSRRRVLHLHIESLMHGEPGQSGHEADGDGHAGVEPDGDGPVAWPGYAAHGAATGPCAGPRTGQFTREPGAEGPDGPVGPAAGNTDTAGATHGRAGICVVCGGPTAGPRWARCRGCLARVAGAPVA